MLAHPIQAEMGRDVFLAAKQTRIFTQPVQSLLNAVYVIGGDAFPPTLDRVALDALQVPERTP
jgi:hypothetical protein